MKFLIVHLSDIHLRTSENPAVAKFPLVSKALQNEEVDVNGAAIVVSGDIAYSGSAEEYKVAIECLRQLRDELCQNAKISEIRFVFVPGNHDCNFELSGSARQTIINAIRKGISAPVDAGMADICCSVQAAFFEFQNSLSGVPTRAEGPLYWEYSLGPEKSRILFRCFNTAWVSQLHEQQGSLFFPETYISDHEPQTTADYYVAVFHHPYNWFPAATYRRVRAHIEKTSDLILTGHEHEPDHYQKYTFRGEVTEYLEGAVFQETDHPERAGFHAIYIDFVAQQQRIVSFSWEKDIFVPTEHFGGWAAFRRGSRGGSRDFVLADDFARWLNDPGAAYSHPAKQGELNLTDIFVFPNVKEFRIDDNSEFVYGSLIEGRDLLKTIGAKNRVLMFGRQQAGKSTLVKVLFRDFYNKGLTPVLVSGDDIRSSHLDLQKFEDLVDLKFKQQYQNPLLPRFQQLDRDKTLLIIDDLDHTSLNPKGRLKFLRTIERRYDRIFVFADDVIKLEELAGGKDGPEILADYHQFEIVQFGYLLRSKLIEQWYSIGSEYVSDPQEIAKKVHTAENLITTLLGKNYLPSFPVFVLSLLQAYDSGSQLNTNVGTYGGLYEVLIFQALAKKWKEGSLDLKKTYLSELAYWMFSHRKRRVSDDDWSKFHADYCVKYKIKPSRQDLKREFDETGLFEEFDQKFGFRHPYAYYYFVARYLRDNVGKTEIKDVLRALCKRLDKQENTNIWLFLTHLSKDQFLVDVILDHARQTYQRFQPARFTDDVKFLADLAKCMEEVVLEDKDFEQIKEDRLRKLDSVPCLVAEKETPEQDEEADEVLKFLSELNLAIKTLEVLGQIVKNFPGSLVGADKFALVKEAYEVGLRTISMVLDLFRTNSADFVELVVERVLENHPDLKESDKRADLEKNLKAFLFWMIEISCFGLLKRISNAVGHSQLSETYQEVHKAINTNAVALIDISVQLDNLGLPDDRLEDLVKQFKGNIFCERLLRQMVVQHFYLFPTKPNIKQKVCGLLKIPIRNVRGLEVKGQGQKLVPSSPKQIAGS